VSDAAFSLGLLAFVLFLSWALGRSLLGRIVRIDDLASADGGVLQVGAGLGALGLLILLLGLAGLFNPAAFLVLVISTTIASWRAWEPVIQALRKLPRQALRSARESGPLGIMALAAGGAIACLATVQALTPPWDYDGLMYHLQAPRLYLEAGRIFLTPDVWQANGPMLGEMLYGLGLSFGSDTFSRLLHLSIAFLLAVATAGMASRHLGARAGWIAFAVLLGIPIYPMWGHLAFADLFWALYEWLAVCSLLRWAFDGNRRWLYLAGILMGFALGSKYLALGTAPLLLLWITIRRRHEGVWAALANGLVFVVPAVVLSGPWFIKNLALAGNPLYPFVFGGPEWDPTRLSTLMAYLRSFGTGRSLADYMLLPWNLFAQHARFGTFMTTIEVPSLLFPIALFFPIVSHPRSIRPLAWLALGRFVLWAVGSQQIRFLLPIFPLAAVLTASVLIRGWQSLEGRVGVRMLVPSLLIGALASTLAYQVIFLGNTRPLPVVLGLESKDSFLERAVYDYPALRYVRQALPPESRVAMLWDGQGYYCDDRCLPDADQSRWVQLVETEGDGAAALDRLATEGFTHILVDYEGASFLLAHDPEGRHRSALEALEEAVMFHHLQVVFVDDKVAVFSVSSQTSSTEGFQASVREH
jgi:4-amino-4-deoxy-L-arabinose transferase-like glycosyltransferase